MYTVFGYSEKYYLNEVYSICLLNLNWRKEEVAGQVPDPRYKHAFALSGNCMYISGGSNDKQVFNDLYKFNLGTNNWMKIEHKGNLRYRFSHSL